MHVLTIVHIFVHYLVGGGSFNPLTRMHLRTYFLAKQCLEAKYGYVVLGEYTVVMRVHLIFFLQQITSVFDVWGCFQIHQALMFCVMYATVRSRVFLFRFTVITCARSNGTRTVPYQSFGDPAFPTSTGSSTIVSAEQ